MTTTIDDHINVNRQKAYIQEKLKTALFLIGVLMMSWSISLFLTQYLQLKTFILPDMYLWLIFFSGFTILLISFAIQYLLPNAQSTDL